MANLAARLVFSFSITLILATSLACGGTSAPAEPAAKHLDAAAVPEALKELVPLAERWGIGDDVDRAAALDRASEDEKAQLRDAIEAHGAEIASWLDSFGSGANMTPEAAAFMYMQLAVEELPE